jgi:hypothetical protein
VGIKFSTPKEATMYRKKHTILKALVLGIAVAAFAAPAALADRDGRPTAQNPMDFWNYDVQTGKKVTNTSPGVRPADLVGLYGVETSASPDDRPLFHGTPPVGNQLDPLIGDAIRASKPVISSPDDRSFYRGVETPNVPASITVSSPSSDFEWGDAGLGAASTLALVLLMGAATFAIRHQRRRLPAF